MTRWLKHKIADILFGSVYSLIEWAIETHNSPEPATASVASSDEGIIKADLSGGPLTAEGRAMIAKPEQRPEPKPKPPLTGGLEERLAKHRIK